MKMDKTWIFVAACIVSPMLLVADEPSPPAFRAQTIDSKVIIGYGTAIGDVDGDGKPDILLADNKQFVWYKNPTWSRFVIAENLTQQDNVCIAARDIDGDGKVEIAVGGQWNPGDTENSGSVHYLVAPEDRTKLWRPIELHHEPVVHRMRWVKLGENEFVLVVAPLHGRGNKGGQGQGVKLLAYRVPKNVDDSWETETLDDSLHVTHNFDVDQWNDGTLPEEILYLGKEGGKLISYDGQQWLRTPLNQVNGGGEIRMGQDSGGKKFLATIEPFHGTDLVYYPAKPGNPTDAKSSMEFPGRIVLDDDLNQGHAVATADLMGTGSHQIVAGWRQPNKAGKVGVKLYYPVDDEAKKWNSVFVDDNSMACEDLRIGDLNADGRPDIVAAGRSTHNLKIYWNEGTPEKK
jgi:hypothetical protein